MSATLAAQPPAGDGWLFEIKWDGVRALCYLDTSADEDQLRIFSRSGRRCERQYPELSVLPHLVAARQAILDGEIAVLDDQGVSRFELIQPRIANTDPNAVAHLARSTPVVLFRLRPALSGWLRPAQRGARRPPPRTRSRARALVRAAPL